MRLLDAMIEAVEAAGLNGEEVGRRYKVGITWYSSVKTGRVKSPSVDTVQRIYEDLTGTKLIKDDPGKESNPGPSVEEHALYNARRADTQ